MPDAGVADVKGVAPMRNLEVSSLLDGCFAETETICVRGCCGIDALDPNAKDISRWARSVGAESVLTVLRELRQLIHDCDGRSDVICIAALNACTHTEDSRPKLIGLLRRYESVMVHVLNALGDNSTME